MTTIYNETTTKRNFRNGAVFSLFFLVYLVVLVSPIEANVLTVSSGDYSDSYHRHHHHHRKLPTTRLGSAKPVNQKSKKKQTCKKILTPSLRKMQAQVNDKDNDDSKYGSSILLKYLKVASGRFAAAGICGTGSSHQLGIPSLTFGFFWKRALVISCACTATKRMIDSSQGTKRALYFWKKAGPIVAHYKFTEWWLRASKAPVEKRHVVYKGLHDQYCHPSLDLVQALQGLYVKLAQTMSSRPDFMPPQYVEVFATVQDSIPQWPIEQVKSITQESFKSELGLDWEDVFESMDPIALGTASIGQVHRAILKDSWSNVNGAEGDYIGGKVVAVKVMHPESKNRFSWDFQVFRWLSRIALPGWRVILDDIELRLMTEFDYCKEAASLSEVRKNIFKSPYARVVSIPQPHPRLCSKYVLVMEMLEGKKIDVEVEDKLTWIFGGDRNKASELIANRKNELLLGTDGDDNKMDPTIRIGDIYREYGVSGVWRAARSLSLHQKFSHYVNLLVDVHGYQIFADGCFNGDPHPGNILVLSDGKRLGLIDYGQTRRLELKDRLDCARIINALTKKTSSVEEIAETMILTGFRTQGNQKEILAEYATLFFDSDHRSKKMGFPTPQHYFQHLMEQDPIVKVPDFAISIARVSLLFRGAGAILNQRVETASHWSKQAKILLQTTEDN